MTDATDVTASTIGTKDRILDTAETLFAERGFAATSLRAITAAADVNLAAVHYHFGSKEALWQAVFARRLGPIQEARLAALDALEADGTPDLEQVLTAYLRPALQLARDPGGRTFMQLAGRAYTEPGDHWQTIVSQFEKVKDRFLPALQRAVPATRAETLMWRVHFMVGVLCHTLSDSHRLCLLHPKSATQNPEAVLQQVLPFLAAGFRAPAHTGAQP